MQLLTSSEVELMETKKKILEGAFVFFLLTSSEVELMETVEVVGRLLYTLSLLTSSEVELMETFPKQLVHQDKRGFF